MTTCDSGHSLKSLNRNQLPYKSKHFICNGCKQRSRSKGFYYVYHCSYCEYDLCKPCYNSRVKGNYTEYHTIYSRPKYDTSSKVKCPSSHGLKLFTCTPNNYWTFSCDGCFKLVSKYQQLYGCRKCNYDLCLSCYGKNNNKFVSKAKNDNENDYYVIYSRPKYDTSSSNKNNQVVCSNNQNFGAILDNCVNNGCGVTMKQINYKNGKADNEKSIIIRNTNCKQGGHDFQKSNGVTFCTSCGKRKKY